MPEPWLPALEPEPGGPGCFRAALRLPADSPWFRGHFPSRPLLPGLGMLALVVHLARQASGRERLRLARVTRCRFKGLVLPGQLLGLAVELSGADEAGQHQLDFDLKRDDQAIGKGSLVVWDPGSLDKLDG